MTAPYNVDMDGNTRGGDGSWDIGAYEVGTGTGGGSVVTVSPITQNASDVDPNTSGMQVYTGTIVQYSGSASSSNPLTWTWVYTVNGGSETVFQTGSGTVPSISFNYTTATAGNTYVWTLRATDGTTTSQSQLTVNVQNPPVAQTGLSFASTSGTITSPFVVGSGYISQPNETGVTDGRQCHVYLHYHQRGQLCDPSHGQCPGHRA